MFSTGGCATYGAEREAPGVENSQTLAALAVGADCVPSGKNLPGAENPNPDALQTRAIPTATTSDTTNLGKYMAKGETRFSVPVKFRKLARTRRATLPPFLADEEPMRDCSALPHSVA